tara:strand:+ start:411 stop:587 length:177 start_codon:yes stop_codon:yes gene_type:complete
MVKSIKLFFLIKTSKKPSKLKLSSREEVVAFLDKETSLLAINFVAENEEPKCCLFRNF